MEQTPESYGTSQTPDTSEPTPGDTRTVDDRGRVDVFACTDRELLEEVAVNLRTIADVIGDLSESPAIAAMMGGGNPMMAMLRNG